MPAFPSQEWLEARCEEANVDPVFTKTGKSFDATLLFDFDEAAYAVTVGDGEIASITPDPTFTAWDIALRAPRETWEKMLDETPPPLYNDLVGAWLQAELTLEGDLKIAIQHLRPLKRLLTIFQETAQ